MAAKAKSINDSAAPRTATTKNTKRRVAFEFLAEPGQSVALAGSFNDWDPTAKVMFDRAGNGVYACTVLLAPGVYEYKFVVDGDWRLDERNPNFAPNDLGTLNSVRVVE